MFKKNKVEEQWSAEDYRVKDCTERFCSIRTSMTACCRTIMEHKGCAEMLPDGADKNYELQEVEKKQQQVLSLIAEYEDLHRQYRSIDESKLVHYNGLTKWVDSHSMLRISWKIASGQI